MAARGAKPKAAHLRIIDGTHRTTRHGDEGKARKSAEGAINRFGRPICPEGMEGAALDAWRRYIDPAFWLDGAREPAAIAFCDLWAEFRSDPSGFAAAKHGQMRAYMSELGLTDERNRGDDDTDDQDEFFDA